MLAKRLIACLDVRDGCVVKGVNFEGLRDAGDPAELARRYNVEGIDELVDPRRHGDARGAPGARRDHPPVARELFIPLARRRRHPDRRPTRRRPSRRAPTRSA